MPDINTLLEKASKKKFKKSSYRPWNYLEELQKEEEEKKQQEVDHPVESTEKQEKLIETNKEESIDIHNQKTKFNVINTENSNVYTQNAHLYTSSIASEDNNLLYIILRLSGHQKTIFALIIEKCLSNGLFSSGRITRETLTSITNTSLSMVNTSIQRLVNKRLIFRENGKRGRGGFYCFGISQETKDAAIECRRLTTLDNQEMPRLTEIQTEHYNLLKSDNRTSSVLSKEWEEIDIEPLNYISFNRSHLIQLYKQGDLDFQYIQDSIYHFSYDLKYNNKSASITKSSPIGYFMGILKRSGVYNAPSNYESPREIAQRQLLEAKKAEKDRIKKLEEEAYELAFSEWQGSITFEQREEIAPSKRGRGDLTPPQVKLSLYFKEHVWPGKKGEYLIL